MAKLTKQEEAIIRTFGGWMETAREEINDIEAWRDATERRNQYSGDPSRYWWAMPADFHDQTVSVASWLGLRYPKSDPAPLLDIYKAVRAWHDDHDASRIPPQAALSDMLDDAVDRLRIVREEIQKPGLYASKNQQGNDGVDANAALIPVGKARQVLGFTEREFRYFLDNHPEIGKGNRTTQAGKPDPHRPLVNVIHAAKAMTENTAILSDPVRMGRIRSNLQKAELSKTAEKAVLEYLGQR